MSRQCLFLRAAVLSVALIAVAASAAHARGSCGSDPDIAHACQITPRVTYAGKVTAEDEQDFYSFNVARRNTPVHVTVYDLESFRCLSRKDSCGSVGVQLQDAAGNVVADPGYVAGSGVLIGGFEPTTLDYRVRRAGTYYLVIDGSLGGGGSKVPYEFSLKFSGPARGPSIAGIRLGMTRSAVQRKIGRPQRVERSTGTVYAYYPDHLSIDYAPRILSDNDHRPRVLAVTSGSPRDRLDSGIHVGSSVKSVRRAYPRVACQKRGRAYLLCALSVPGPRNTFGDVPKLNFIFGRSRVKEIDLSFGTIIG